MNAPCPPSERPASSPAVPIRIVPQGSAFRVVRSGARYAVERRGELHPGRWLPLPEPLPDGWADTFPEAGARALGGVLAARESRGRPTREPTSDAGRVVVEALEALDFDMTELAEALGVSKSLLSRALDGTLAEEHQARLRAWIAAARAGM